MDASIAIVDILSLVAGSVPHAGPFQPVLGAVNILLQRAQRLSDDQQKLASIAAQAAKLVMRLSDMVDENIDHLDVKLTSHLDEITGILHSITSEIQRLDKKSSFRKFILGNKITVKTTRLYDRLQGVVNECHIILGIDSAVKLGQTRNIVLMTHERVSEVQTQLQRWTSVQQTQRDDDTGLQILFKEDLQLLSTDVRSRTVELPSNALVRVSTYDATLRQDSRVVVKKFEASEPRYAKDLFEEELKALKKTWEPVILQPFGHSQRKGDFFYIVYHSPSVNARIPLPILLKQCLEKGDNLIVPVLFSLPNLIRQWASTVPVNPLEEVGDIVRDGSFYDWIEKIAFDSGWMAHRADALPFYEGELLCMTEMKRSISETTEHMMSRVFSWLSQILEKDLNDAGDKLLMKTSLDVCKLHWGSYCPLPSPAKPLPLMTLEDLERTITESGWQGLNGKPSLFFHGVEVVLSGDWRWFKGRDRFVFWSCKWIDDLECRMHEEVVWRTDLDHGYHHTMCICDDHNGKAHGCVRYQIDNLRIIWPQTPLDDLQFQSANYFDGMAVGDWEVLVPGLLATKMMADSSAAEIAAVSDDESSLNDQENYQSAEEDPSELG